MGMYGGVEVDGRDEPDTVAPMAGEQHVVLLWRSDSKRKQCFLQHSNNKEPYTNGSQERKEHRKESRLCFAAVFVDIIRRGALPEVASIHTAEMTEKKGHEMGNIYRLAQFNAGHREQQRERSNIKSDMTY